MITNRSLPAATVIPVLVYPDVRAAVGWLTDALGFRERVRIGEDHRAQMQGGEDGAVIIADEGNGRRAPLPGELTHLIKVRVPDVDAATARAREHGGRVVSEPHEFEYGERESVIEDPAGHRWNLTQTVRDVAPEDWGGLRV